MEWVISIVLGIGVVILVILLNNQQKKNKDNLHQIEKLNHLYEDQKVSIDRIIREKEEETRKSAMLMQKWIDADNAASTFQNELIQLQSLIQVEAVKNDSKETLEAELEKLKALAVEKLSELQQITANTQKLAQSQNEKLEEIAKLEAGMKVLEGRICSGKKVLENLEDEITSTNNHLQLLVTLKANVLAVESGEGSVWEFKIPSDKSRLVELIHQLVDEYGNAFPILKKELLKAEWSSVWLPQVQQLCSREGLDRSGIYRLTLKSNPDCVYIGQAQSIKDRWYTHIKKMLGVEAKGAERLYEYRPDDFEWSVVEFKEGNLDSDEKYWIDYYKCREIGLNKKG